MTDTGPQSSLLKDRFFRTSLASTVLVFLACLSTHLLTIAGVAGAIALGDTLEHGLMFAAIAFAGLTIYAVVRHRRCASCAQASDTGNKAP